MKLPFDKYYYFHPFQPIIKAHFDWKILRRTSWSHLINRDGSEGRFVSWWVFNHLQFYHGTTKCDGSESTDAGAPPFVMTDEESEMWAFRWRTNGPGEPMWNNMGGS